MLILAGVSLNATIGENGIITKAMRASVESEKASILENLNIELALYNLDTINGNKKEMNSMLNNLIKKGLIDTILCSDNTYKADPSLAIGIPNFDDDNKYTGFIDYSVKKGEYQIILSVDDEGIYKAYFGQINISSGGVVAEGTTVVTKKAFENDEASNPEEQGKFTIDKDASIMFTEEIEGELSIYVKSGVHAKVNVFKDMTLTNTGIKRSAIDIEPGGTLDLWVTEGAELIVKSGIGGEGGNGETPEDLYGGPGAYAGIHVPKTSILNLSGGGTIYCYGGDAGDGGTSGNLGVDCGNGGGGGAGAGIGGNGGMGGTGSFSYDSINNGLNGEDAGKITFDASITVFAYGGGGGSGGGGTPGKNTTVGGGGARRRISSSRNRWRRCSVVPQVLQFVVEVDFLVVHLK